MKLQLTHPTPDSDAFADLPLDLRREVKDWLRAFDGVASWQNIGHALANVAAIMGVSAPTARRKYDALRAEGGDWRAIADGRRTRRAAGNHGTANREFRNFITALAERHQRNSTAAYRKFCEAWKARTPMPGFEDFDGWPKIPFSKRTFLRIVAEETDARRLRSIRVGTSSKSGADLAQVFTTRQGLYPGAVYQFDDVWHDNFVTIGHDPDPVRVLELGVLDLFSGCRFHWGCKPRMRKADGSGMENLKEREMRFFLAGVLWNHGTSPRGTRIMVEHGTAAIRADVAEMLEASGLGISIDRQPIEGKQQALTGYWPGTEGGNFRAKAHLESLHNLMHNDLSHLLLQTGSPSSGLAGPVTTDRQISYIQRILKSVLDKAPHRAELLRLPSLDFHSQFLPYLNDYYTLGLNGRTDHELEGWKALGFLKTEYTLAPGSGQYLSGDQFLALPDNTQTMLREAARADSAAYTRRRNLSPLEVWNSGRRDLRPAPAPLICDILGKDLAREVKVRGSYIRFRDQDISPDELIYAARVHMHGGAQRELRDGEKFLAFANPFAPSDLFLLDARDRYLGVCRLEQRITATDRTGIIAAAGFKSQRNAEILQPLRNRHAETVQETREMRAHNAKVIAGDPVTPEETAAARSASAHKATSTRRAREWQGDAPADVFADETPAPAQIDGKDIADWLED
jgi:hypothetical protein